jgi:hypothetical protein
MPNLAKRWMQLFLIAGANLGCSSVATLDLDCPKLCVAALGPTIPGAATLAASLDGGVVGILDAAAGALAYQVPAEQAVTWTATLEFDQVLSQLPNEAVRLSADVRLRSITLASIEPLDFVDTMEVYLAPTRSPSSSVALDASAPPTPVVDGGASPLCRDGTSELRVAYFQSGDAPGPGRSSLDLTLVEPGLNLFDCMKDAPIELRTRLVPKTGIIPSHDTPLTLDTCIASHATASYP